MAPGARRPTQASTRLLSLAGRTARAEGPRRCRRGSAGSAAPRDSRAGSRAPGIDARGRRHPSLRGAISAQRGAACARGRRAAARPPPAALDARSRATAGSRSPRWRRRVAALGAAPRRVFLTVGRLELAAFAAAPQHRYLVRTIEPIGDALPVPHVTRSAARAVRRGRRSAALMRAHGIEVAGDQELRRRRRPTARSPRRAGSGCRSSWWRSPGSPTVPAVEDAAARLWPGSTASSRALRSSAACRRTAPRLSARRCSRVVLAPMITSVAMSAGAVLRLGERQRPRSPRPAARPRGRTSPASRARSSRGERSAAPSCQGRADEIGL